MKYVFYRIKPYEQAMQRALDMYFTEKGIYREYSSVQSKKDILKEAGREFAIFYPFDAEYHQKELHQLVKNHGIKAKIVALCSSYEDGIRAMEEGGFYALQIPLNNEKIIRCCRLLDQGIQHERGIHYERKNY